MGVKRPQLFTPEEIAALMEPEDAIRQAFAEMERNECVLKKLEASGSVLPGYAAAWDGRLISWAPSWDELEPQLVRGGYFGPGTRRRGMVIRHVAAPVPKPGRRPQLFTPEEIAALLEPDDVTRRRFAEAEKNEQVLKNLEDAAEVGPGYAAACDGRVLGWAPTWEELKDQLVRDGWYWTERYPIGLVVRHVTPPTDQRRDISA